ncbi:MULTISPECIES: hypothetical protein [Nostocales]|uniref:Ferritin-like domain-containing protein n=3 Tax=Nostocales TaxID=1161 RepID=A0A0C1MXG4_9CYAN|nr:hypothetical protein [Tolypothrix bouteillei]KAF3889600.1 hypothetical protein DA73_0400032110 [Tolypothrix bouteillei VB521301]
MTATLTRPAWTTEWEVETINKLIAQHAPHLPTTRLYEPRPPATDEELENFYRFRIAGAAHDLFIVQVCAKAITDIVPDDIDLQLFISRQLGDDGEHSQHTRQRVFALSGRDPIEDIQQAVQQHWKYMGALPVRNWLGFLAFELHYELHIVAQLIVNSRLTRINDPESSNFASKRILPDEAVHRLGVVAWWQKIYDSASLEKKSKLAAQLIEVDEEGQKRRNPYLKEHWQLVQKALGFEAEGFDVIYDAWRKEVLSHLLNIPVSKLPKLVSIND